MVSPRPVQGAYGFSLLLTRHRHAGRRWRAYGSAASWVAAQQADRVAGSPRHGGRPVFRTRGSRLLPSPLRSGVSTHAVRWRDGRLCARSARSPRQERLSPRRRRLDTLPLCKRARERAGGEARVPAPRALLETEGVQSPSAKRGAATKMAPGAVIRVNTGIPDRKMYQASFRPCNAAYAFTGLLLERRLQACELD